MFRLADAGLIWAPVVLPLGQHEGEVSIRLLLKVYSRDELRERERSAMDRASALMDHTGESQRDHGRALVDEAERADSAAAQELLDRVRDWRDVLDESGQPQEFSRDRLEALLQYSWFLQSCRSALFDVSRSGVAKNWKPGPGGSPVRAQA